MKYFLYLFLILLCSVNIVAQKGIIKEITYSGNKKTKATFLNKIKKVKKGEKLDSLKIQTDIERLKRLDGIAHADYTVTNENDNYIVNYNLTENFSIIPGLQIGQANDDSFSFRVSVFEFNALGRNIIVGGFYKREVFNSYGFYIEHPYLFNNKWGLGFNYQNLTTQQPIYFNTVVPRDTPLLESESDREQINYTYTSKAPELTLFYEHDFNNRFELGVKIIEDEYLVIKGDPQNEGVINALEPKINQQSVRGSYEYIDLDIEYHNVSGFRSFFEATYFSNASSLLQTDYILNSDTQYFKRIGEKGNWANRLQFQYSNPVDNTNFTPITIDNQLNTRGAGNTIDRGTAAFALNTEYRHTFIEKDWFVLQGNTFLDISGIQRPGEDFNNTFSKETFRAYPGVGVRFIHKRILNAALRFDYGVNITGNGSNGFVFGIGQYF